MAPDAIFGREEELAAATRFFDDVRDPAALIIQGDAGIGKTTIWLEAVRIAAATSRVLTSRASESETTLSFAILTDLLEPALHEVRDELPAPQLRALEAALLLKDPSGGAQPDARAVSLGVLGAIRALAARTPVTLAIDDVHWTDAPSAGALSFALRRLVDEPVTVVVASRIASGVSDPLDLARSMPACLRLDLGPIRADALRGLLRRLDGAFPHPLARRIQEASGGNPLLALEIGRALIRLGVRPKPGQPLPVPHDVHALLRDRLAALRPGVLEVLLIVAASASPTVELVEEAGGSLPALEEAARRDVLILRDSAVGFTHPLLASTVYTNASLSSRRNVHRRLARIAIDVEEKARHLALSSSRPSREVAAALDEAALGARARGAPQAASEFCELAIEATPEDDVSSRHRRAMAQAGNLFDAGDPPRAREILAAIIDQLPAGALRSEALCALSEFCWKDLGRVSELLRQALVEVGDQPVLHSRILSDLAWVDVDGCDLTSAVDRARAAVALAESADDNAYCLRLSLSTLAIAEFLMGRPNDELIDRALQLQGPLGLADLSSPATCLGRQLTWEGRLDEARQTLEAELVRYREQGHETARYEILAHLAEVEHRAGRFVRASNHLAEAEDIAAEAGVDVLGEILPVRAAVRAATGEPEGARRDALEGMAICDRTADTWNEIRCRSVLGTLEISRRDHRAAHAWLDPLPSVTEAMGLREPGVFPFIPDAVEALVGLGELDHAKELTEQLEQQGRELGRPLALGTAARCHGLIAAALGDLPGAATFLERSSEDLRLVPQPFERARTLLLAGEIQRRMRKKRSARDVLGEALATFEEIGAHPWAEMARREVARIGGRAPSPDGLTPNEEQVALLVAEGRTNREVAAALFVSVHTVESNLKRIYRKLGVRSRTELARTFADRAGS